MYGSFARLLLNKFTQLHLLPENGKKVPLVLLFGWRAEHLIIASKLPWWITLAPHHGRLLAHVRRRDQWADGRRNRWHARDPLCVLCAVRAVRWEVCFSVAISTQIKFLCGAGLLVWFADLMQPEPCEREFLEKFFPFLATLCCF